MKKDIYKKFTLITSFISILILLIGTTFSYFTITAKSEHDAVVVEAERVLLGLGVSPIYTGHKIIPTNDEDIMKAYKRKCVDDYQNGACLAYGLEIFNYSKAYPIIGKIDFTVEGIKNLSYMVLDENDNIYLDKTSITGNTTNMPLGPNFKLKDATNINPSSKKFVLLVWLTNLKDEDQSDYDAGGSFNAKVTYESIYGGKLTATVDGYQKESEDITQIGDA